MPEEPSRVLAGRYLLRAPLGEGGMGVVWRARDELLHQTVAVKEMRPPAGLPAEDRERLLLRTLREARTAATLRGHPGIVTVYDVVEEDGRPWIVMELVEGPSMAEVLRAEGRLAEARVAEIGLRVISALAAAEAAGIVHRDVKPANILLRGDRAVLTDFGIAAAVHDTTDLTGAGQLLGTIPYLAPEQLGGERASAASDLWATGVTLYEAVEGRRPFERESPMATIAAIINRPAAPTRYADRLGPVIEGLLRKDPAERLTAGQAEALLAPVAAGAAPDRVNARSPEDGRSWQIPGPTGYAGPAWQAPSPAEDGGRAQGAAPAGTGPTSSSDHARSGASRRPRPQVMVAAGAAVLAVAVAAAVIWGVQGGSATPESAGTPGPGAGSTAPTGSGGESGQNPPSSPVPDSLPRGFTLHKDSRGFSIAVPDGWTKDEAEDQVSWSRPESSILSSSSWYLGAFANLGRKETRTPAAILDELRDALRKDTFAPDSYRELVRRPISVAGGDGAELEFGFAHKDASGMPFRLYARCVIRDSGGVGMFWFFAPAGQWAEASGHVDTFVETFRLN
ncbi:protein kinase [Streptosporangium sp. NPDC002544]|uniref:serine/threonine-protein kinase n=1 Tax=Streptosporangium sp. NPDC002544 TaxID=3154538 RepID=UPI00332C42E9